METHEILQSAKLGYLSAGARVSTRPDAELVGPRAHVLGMIGGFRSRGWQVSPYIVGDKVPPYWVQPGSENVARGSWLRTLGIDMLRMAMGMYHAVRAAAQLRREVDWVYERGALLQAMGWAFQGAGIPWILETNSLQWKEAVEDRDSLVLTEIARRIEFASYRACDVLVPVSNTLKNILIEEGVDPRKIVVVPNGVDTSTFDPAAVSPVRHHEGFTIGFVGALSGWQALDMLIRAIHDLQHAGLDVNAKIIGDGHARAEWEAEARRLGVEEHVTFTGYLPRSEVPAHIAGFDVGYSGPARLATGNMYMSPIKLYEYLAMATPVVAAAYEDARRLLEPRNTGYLFTPESLDDLKRALREAYAEQEALLEYKGQEARAAIVANHSWEARVRYLVEAVPHVLQRTGESVVASEAARS